MYLILERVLINVLYSTPSQLNTLNSTHQILHIGYHIPSINHVAFQFQNLNFKTQLKLHALIGNIKLSSALS